MDESASSASASSASSQNDLLCKLKQLLDTIFDDKKQISEKISKIIDIATLPPGACGGGIKPLDVDEGEDEAGPGLGPGLGPIQTLAVMFPYLSETEYFANVVSETRESQLRTDVFYTVTVPMSVSSKYDDIFKNDIKNVVVGQSNVNTWGSNLLGDNTKKLWPASSTALLKKDQLKQIVGSYDEKSGTWYPAKDGSAVKDAGDPAVIPASVAPVAPPAPPAPAAPAAPAGQVAPMPTTEDTNDLLKDYLILGPIQYTNVYDYKNNTYVSVQEIQIIRGSDKLYYMLEALPKDPRDLNKVLYKLSVFKTRAMAVRARNVREMVEKKK